jgi:curved DNA-binding protein CbpA
MLASTANLNQCYQLLGIDRDASIDRLKAAYRSLARKWHPDLNPGDVDAHQRFIALNQAYQTLLEKTPADSTPSTSTTAPTNLRDPHRHTPPPAATPAPRQDEAELKWQIYDELQSLLKQQHFLKAIVLIEGLAHHSPQDRQICQWQGIIYSQYGQQLIQSREFDKARIYLKKALKVNPHNRQLWQEVDRAFNRITQLT